ncbi:MAG: serine hydrolase [Bacteroidetes bacterium]|nr:serine hydrolase [Bacteroidota bacterium]
MKFKRYFLLVVLWLVLPHQAKAQTLYFPPTSGATWDTISPIALGWCPDKIDTLTQFLLDKNTKAFIVLKDGKIAIEKYFGTFTQDSIWYWASAGKSLTAFLTGVAQEEGILNTTDTVSNYLGAGWTSCPTPDEEKIRIIDQLSMTSGFDDLVPDPDCTDPACLNCIAPSGTRWAYHNAPYHLLHDVIETASGTNWNQYTFSKLTFQTGISGAWVDHVFYSKARTMARFGLLVQAQGSWDNTVILGDTTYFNQMLNTSQSFNPSYGYLWWLNGKGSYMLPGLQAIFPGDLIPNAPADMVAALGKNDQKVYVVPSLGLTVIRMGDSAGAPLFALSSFDNELWGKLNAIFCTTSMFENITAATVSIYPIPAKNMLYIKNTKSNPISHITIRNSLGQICMSINSPISSIDISTLKSGVYTCQIFIDSDVKPEVRKLIVE